MRTPHEILQDIYWLGKEDFDPACHMDKWLPLLKELFESMLIDRGSIGNQG
jgi:hypothetical protein